MIEKPMDVLSAFPVRKSKRQKAAFRESLQAYVGTLGYESKVEKGKLGVYNVVIGDPVKAKYLVTAHYDTCARLPLPNFITPCNFLVFLLYQVVVAVVIFWPVFLGEVLIRYYWGYYPGIVFLYVSLFAMIYLMLAGPANRSNANDNTSGVVTVLELARSLSQDLRGQVCFVLFDLEEAGLLGSAAYKKAHRQESKDQIVFNLDCVGEGDQIMLFPTGKFMRDPEKMVLLRESCGDRGEMNVALRKPGFAYYPSDQTKFSYGVGICALRHHKVIGHYLGRIHTPRDTVLRERNVTILRDWLTDVLRAGAEERN